MHTEDGPWVGETVPMGIEKRNGFPPSHFKPEINHPMGNCVVLCVKERSELAGIPVPSAVKRVSSCSLWNNSANCHTLGAFYLLNDVKLKAKCCLSNVLLKLPLSKLIVRV